MDMASQHNPSPFRFSSSASKASASIINNFDGKISRAPLPQRFVTSGTTLTQPLPKTQTTTRQGFCFTSTAADLAKQRDCIEDQNYNEFNDSGDERYTGSEGGNTIAKKPIRRHNHPLCPASKTDVSREKIFSQMQNKVQDDENTSSKANDEVPSHNAPKRRHHPTPTEQSRFVLPRLFGASSVKPQILSTSRRAMATQVSIRPSFRIPSEPITQHIPLAFSPRRRGETFVSGGLATMTRAWIMEAAQATPINVPIVIESKSIGSSFTLVRGLQARAILVNFEDDANEGSKIIITRGWIVDIEASGSWAVGVEWLSR